MILTNRDTIMQLLASRAASFYIASEKQGAERTYVQAIKIVRIGATDDPQRCYELRVSHPCVTRDDYVLSFKAHELDRVISIANELLEAIPVIDWAAIEAAAKRL